MQIVIPKKVVKTKQILGIKNNNLKSNNPVWTKKYYTYLLMKPYPFRTLNHFTVPCTKVAEIAEMEVLP